jgi:glutamine synthetase
MIETVVLGVVDHNGILRGKQVPVENFISICESGCGLSTGAFMFDYTDFPIAENRFSNFANGIPDMIVKPDLSSFTIIPWANRSAFVMVDCFHSEGNPVAINPRQILKNIVLKARESGFSPDMGLEYEFLFFLKIYRQWPKRDISIWNPNCCF